MLLPGPSCEERPGCPANPDSPVDAGTKAPSAGCCNYLGRYYVLYVNHRYGRSGTLWDGRYKASLIQEEDYLLACYRYIELNPVRAGMVDGPGAYRWSSYHRNAPGTARPRRRFSRALPRAGTERTTAPGGL